MSGLILKRQSPEVIDISAANSLSFIVDLKQEVIDASILCEVSYQEGNERS